MQGSISIIGAGRVGRAMARRLRELDWVIGSVIARSLPNARRAVRFIGGGKAYEGITRSILASQVILLAVPDNSIAAVAEELARIGSEELKGKIVLHTSGSLDSSVLAPVHHCGAATASMHPMQTFSGIGVPPLQGRLFAIEGDESAVRISRQIARAVGGIPLRIHAKDKILYHAAGVFAAGHSLAVVEAATRLLMSIGLKRKEAMSALLPMTRQMLDNYERFGPKNAWTGPLSRGDSEVVSKHVHALGKFSPEYRLAYDALNRLAVMVLAKGDETRWQVPRKKTDKRVKAMAMGGSK